MIDVGASTANLYPEVTEESLRQLLSAGFRQIEVFLNTESEAEPAFIKELRRQADDAGASIRSVHPYLSGTEPFLLFSNYERRFRDGLKIYERIFEAAAMLGASIVVMHGDKAQGILPVEESIGRFEMVYDLGKTYGLTLAQENVVRFRSSDNDYIRAMRRQLGDKAHFVLDLKQAIRCGHSWESVLDAMGENVVHLHISDHTRERDCIPPGIGITNFSILFDKLEKISYQGIVMLELYRHNFQYISELVEAKDYLWNLSMLYG